MAWSAFLTRLLSRQAPEAENVRLVDAYEALERHMGGRLLDNALGIQQRPIPIATRWQPYHRDEIREECEQGVMLRLGYFCDFMSGNGQIDGLCATRTDGMLRRDAIFGGDPWLCEQLAGRPTVRDEQTGVVVDQGRPGLWRRMVPSTEFGLVLRDWMLAGVGLGEMVNDPTGLPCLRHLPIHWLRYSFGEERWLYQAPGKTYEVRPGDGRWVMLTKSLHRPWAHGAWYPLAMPAISMAGTELDRLRWQGQLADPLRAIRASKSSNEGQRRSLLRFILDKWHRAPALVHKDDEQAYLVESNGRGFEVYNDSDDRAERRILYTLAGQTVTGEGNKGFNSLDGFDNIRLDIVQKQADAAAECAERDILAPWGHRFWGAPPDAVTVGWDIRSAAQRVAEAEALRTSLEAVEIADRVFAPHGAEVDLAAYIAQHRLPLPTRQLRTAARPVKLLPLGTVRA